MFGGTPRRAARWLQIQNFAGRLASALQAAAPGDYLSMAFDNRRLIVQLYITADADRTEIRRCARNLGIKQRLRMTIHHWTDAQKGAAAKAIIAALPDLFANQLFDVAQPPQFDGVALTVWQPASDDDVERIRQAASATGVPFTINRLDFTRPQSIEMAD